MTPDGPSAAQAAPRAPAPRPVAEVLAPVIGGLVGEQPRIRFEFWDGSTSGPDDAIGVIRAVSADALRRLLWMPNELGLGRAYVAGDLDVDGDLFTVLEALRDGIKASRQSTVSGGRRALQAARELGLVGRPPTPPAEESRLHGIRHTLRRDARAIGHHYDVGNDFYRIVLGDAMTYSCARFVTAESTLEEAQAAKHELICRKLGLHERPGMRLLDIGCGWGSLAIHAAARHQARVVGITISDAQARLARQRVADAGLGDLVEIRLQDYRDLRHEQFDAIASVGMSEHVGHQHLRRYFEIIHAALAPRGRVLNHAIASVGGSKMSRTSFVGRYVFPDGELIDIGRSVLAMEQAGLEIRDIESLREHYARTLRLWVANLEREWDRAVDLAGVARARIWRLYMAGSAIGFEDGGISIHQTLAVKPTATGASGMPPTRAGWA